MRHQAIIKLLDNLSRQKLLHLDLLELAKKETDLLLNADLKNLSNVTTITETVIRKIEEAEGERIDIMSELTGGSGTKSFELSMDNLIKEYPQETDELLQIKKELNILLENIKTVASKNTKLIKRALSGIDYIKNLFNEYGLSVLNEKV